MGLARYTQVGAKFIWPHDNQPLQEARDLHTVVGNPGVCDSPYGKALDFNGAGDYIILGDSWEDQLRFDAGTQDFAIVAYVQHTVTGDFQFIFDKRDASGDGYMLRTIADDSVIFALNGVVAATANPLVEDAWHVVGVSVVRSGDAQLYLDGQPDGSPVAVGGAVMATTIAPHIGTLSYAPTNYWTGCIAGIVIFDRTLSVVEHAGMASGGGPF